MRPLLLAGLLALAACGQNPDAMNAAKMALTAAETAATVYVQLPLCPQPTGRLCSDAAISAQIKAADQIAYDGVKSMSDGKITVADATALISKLVVLIPVKK